MKRSSIHYLRMISIWDKIVSQNKTIRNFKGLKHTQCSKKSKARTFLYAELYGENSSGDTFTYVTA